MNERSANIVVGTDFSDMARHAVDEAIGLARPLGASLTLVHAYELPGYVPHDPPWPSAAETLSFVMSSASRSLEEEVRRCQESGVSAQGVLEQGHPWEVVVAAAAKVGARMIVVGTHGRRGVGRLLLGSVAERILRTSTRPVLVVHGESA